MKNPTLASVVLKVRKMSAPEIVRSSLASKPKTKLCVRSSTRRARRGGAVKAGKRRLPSVGQGGAAVGASSEPWPLSFPTRDMAAVEAGARFWAARGRASQNLIGV